MTDNTPPFDPDYIIDPDDSYVCVICGCDYTPKPNVKGPLCEPCWEEHKIEKTDCEICGTRFPKESNGKFSICKKCLYTHVFTDR